MGDRAGGAAQDGYQVHIDALKVQEHVEAAFALTRNIVQEINRLVIGLETGTGEEDKSLILVWSISVKCYQFPFFLQMLLSRIKLNYYQ